MYYVWRLFAYLYVHCTSTFKVHFSHGLYSVVIWKSQWILFQYSVRQSPLNGDEHFRVASVRLSVITSVHAGTPVSFGNSSSYEHVYSPKTGGKQSNDLKHRGLVNIDAPKMC